MKKKILIIGESDSVYIKEYVEHMQKSDVSLKFAILTYKVDKYADFYRRHGIQMICMPNLYHDMKDITWYEKGILYFLRNRFDYVHVQAVGYNQLEKACIIAGNKSKLVMSYWAHPTGKKDVYDVKKKLKQVHKISFVTNTLKEEFQKNYGHGYDEKLSCMDLYLGALENLKRVVQKNNLYHLKKIAKKKLNFPMDKTIVALGYCGRKDQQHIKALRELEKLSDDVLKTIYLHIHVAYGVSDQGYIKQIKRLAQKLEQRGCQCEVSREFMTGNKLVCLRLAMDVFVNVEVQDVLSSTMLEYVCAGTTVINGAWLDYHELGKYGVCCRQISGMEDLSNMVSECVGKKNVDEKNSLGIMEYSCWDKWKEKWLALYDEEG